MDARTLEMILKKYRYALWRTELLEGYTSENISNEMMTLIESTIDILQGDKSRKGQKQYAILHHTYFTQKSPTDTNEILDALRSSGMSITTRTYFRLKSEALEMIAKEIMIMFQSEMKKHNAF